MSDRATVFQTTQVGVESVAGTQVPADHRLVAIQIEPKPMTPVKPFRNMGSKFTNDTFIGKDWTQADVKGEACYRTLTWLFSCILTTAVVTTPAGGTDSRLWTFTPNTFGPDSPVTLTVESGSSAGAESFTFGVLDTLALRYTKEEVGISGSMFGQQLVEGITLTSNTQNEIWHVDVGLSSSGTFRLGVRGDFTAPINWNDNATAVGNALKTLTTVGASDVTVTGTGASGDPWVITFVGALAGQHLYPFTAESTLDDVLTATEFQQGLDTADVTPKPIQPIEVQVLVGEATDYSDLTVLDRCFEAEFSISNRFTQVITLNSADPSYSSVVERAPDMTATLLIEHDDTVSVGFMQDLRARQTKYCRIKATSSDFIEGSIPWYLQITFPFRFLESTRADKDDVWCSTYKLQPIHDENVGYAVEVQLQNDITTI